MYFAPHKIRVGVLRGGPSPEYEISLGTGATILANLPEECEPLDILISREGGWHIKGLEKEPHQILRGIDLAINAMHGAYGEDGKVQKILEHFNIPYTGSDSLSSALGMNKIMSKNIFRSRGLKAPHHMIVQKEEGEIPQNIARKINESIPFPVIVKPINSGSSLGVSFAENPLQIKEALKKSFEHSPQLLVEEYINGKEVTCGVIDDFRGHSIYPLLPVEIMARNKEGFCDYDAKYNPEAIGRESRYRVPANITEKESEQIKEAAILIHQILGLRHYSRSDFILHPRRGLFVLEVNTLPELTHRSSFIKSLEALGSNIKEFLSHLLSKTLKK